MRKELTIGLILLLVFTTFNLHAQSGFIIPGVDFPTISEKQIGGKGSMACKVKKLKKQKDYKCGQCEEPLINDFDELLEKIENKPESYNKIEDVLSDLPEKLRTDVIFMGKSRSLQQGDRYLMKSPGSELVVSFNGHPGNRGGNNVEVMKFNGKTGTFDFIDIALESGKAVVRKNPRKCAKCHGSGAEARPIFDPYRFWSNQIPSIGDTVVPGTKESEDFLAFVDKIENKDKNPDWDRFKHLKPFLKQNSKKKILAGFKKDGFWHVKTQARTPGSTSSGADGPGVRLFDEMYLNNHCRINNLLQQNPNFDTIKYALAGAVNGCFRSDKDMEKFLPAKITELASEYFSQRGITKKKDKDVYGKVSTDTRKKQDEYFEDRVGRKLWMLEERFKKDEPSLTEEEAYQKAKYELIDTNKRASKNKSGKNFIFDREESADLVAPFRYILEPIGFNTSNLSISFDPGSYTFGDFITNISNFEPLLSLAKRPAGVREKFFCDKLAKDSKNAYQAKANELVDSMNLQCSSLEVDDKQLDDLADINKNIKKTVLEKERSIIRPDLMAILDDADCIMCHKENSSRGAPNLPFGEDDIDSFDALMNKTAGELGDMRKRIWSRINRPTENHGAMPPGGLTIDEKGVIKKYLETFQGNMRKDENKVRLDSGSLINY